MSELKATLDSMKNKFDADAASGLDLVFQFEIDSGDQFNIIVADGECKINLGVHESPSVTLLMNEETLTGLMDGSVDGMQAFMAGQLRAEGDMMLATKLGELFPV